MWKFFWAREITVDTAFRSCDAMGTYLSTHAIASQAQSRCLNGNLTRLDSAATPRAAFLNLVTVNRKYYTKLALLVSDLLKKRGLRPLWHFCKQKSPIPSQFPHAFEFWLRSDGGFWEKLRWRGYKVGNNLCFEGIGAICEANRRKGALPPSLKAPSMKAALPPKKKTWNLPTFPLSIFV